MRRVAVMAAAALLSACEPDQPARSGGDGDDGTGGTGGTGASGPRTWYVDVDGDGYGVDDPATNVTAVEQPYRMVAEAGDCDDRASNVRPGAPESCDGRDNDCNGDVDENPRPYLGAVPAYIDADGDGYGAGAQYNVCEAGPGESHVTGDCDDDDAAVYPGADEDLANGVDDNCDGMIDRLGVLTGALQREVGVDQTDVGQRDCSVLWTLQGQAQRICPDCDYAFSVEVTLDESTVVGDLDACLAASTFLDAPWGPTLGTFGLGFIDGEDGLDVVYGLDVEAWARWSWEAYAEDYYGAYTYYYYGYSYSYGYNEAGWVDRWLRSYPSGFQWMPDDWSVSGWDGDTVNAEYGIVDHEQTDGTFETDRRLIEATIE